MTLTPLRKLIARAPPADTANYLWNVSVFAAMGAGVAPLVWWSSLRSVPLWRTIVEPLTGALLGAVAPLLLGSGAALLVLTPLGRAQQLFALLYRMGAVASRIAYNPDDNRRLERQVVAAAASQSDEADTLLLTLNTLARVFLSPNQSTREAPAIL